MSALDLIGAVGAASLRQRVSGGSADDGVARYMLDRLSGAQVSAIVKALHADQSTRNYFTILLPRELVAGHGLPEEYITDERTTHIRHGEWSTPALLMAEIDDDQRTSLEDVTLLGAKAFTEESELWVLGACEGLALPDDHRDVWTAALKGLVAAEDWSLQQMASYVALTRSRIKDESQPLLDALGWALPALQLPRDSGIFRAMRQKDQGLTGKWKKQFEKLVSVRGPLLLKQRKPGQVIDADELRAQWINVKDEVQPAAHTAIEAFIPAAPNWNAEAAAVAEFEYEADGIFQLFTGMRQKKLSLAEETLDHFDDHLPGRLSDLEKEYLEQLKKRRLREGNDDDREFFEAHREEIGQNKSLRAKWEKFIFGKAIECTDLLMGLVDAMDRLCGQTAPGPRTLEIRSTARTKAQWLQLNADVGLAFSYRYRGLPGLIGSSAKWDAQYIFAYDALLEQQARRKKYRRNESTKRASLQIKFDITLKVVQGATTERATVQLIWNGRPNAMGIELPGDLERLEARPLMMSSVDRQSISRKGGAQALSLSDVTTLEPAYGKDSGSLVTKLTAGSDLARKFPQALKDAVAAGRATKEGAAAIKSAWDSFSVAYGNAIKAWRKDGIKSDALIGQVSAFDTLLRALAEHAPGDVNRQEMVRPVLAIGCVPVTGGPPTAIVAPWHPMRMLALSLKARAVSGLIVHIMKAEDVNFGDRRLFFSDLKSELEHPWYPEVAVGYAGSEPQLLAETSTLNEYSLMERPVRDPSEASTDVDPREAARQIRQLLGRYLELQPHESSNLSIMLYNCDAAGLPVETVNALGSVSDQNEVHCNVLVRHRERDTLGRVYGELIERAESDPDALVVSETSRNFMSKLRIGVLLDSGSQDTGQQREVDVAFLHDVVARHAKEAWVSVPGAVNPAQLYEHVPARWSYRRVSADDELKATNFLVCPRQPSVGWAYLDAVAAVVRQQATPAGQHMLPARQISFEDQTLKSMFEEVHNTAEWVATYDELLDKRQLRAQRINVIRYRRQRTNGRNMVVSSTAELRILRVLVRKRLRELSLDLPDERLASLAQRMIDDALAVSGDIVLRAAKRGVSAGELIGIVLSRALIAEEFSSASGVAWFLLDDYAEWLGQREQGIADILALGVTAEEDGGYRLKVIVTEAKFVSADGSAEAQRGSKQQLRQTILRVEDALFGDPGRMDRDLWLARIADLLLDGEVPIGQSQILEEVRDRIRSGTMPIDLRGYSHVFISGPADGGGVTGRQETLGDIRNGLQEVFSRQDLRLLIKAYEAGQPLQPVRAKLGSEGPWDNDAYRSPSPRVSWIKKAKDEAAEIPSSDDDLGQEPETDDDPPVDEAPVTKTSGPQPQEPGLATEAVSEPGEADTPVQEQQVGAPSNDFAKLVRAMAIQGTGAAAGDEQWLKSIEQTLRTALMGYNLQAKVRGSRLTPNAALIRFEGSDRLRVEDIEAKQSALLTTHGLRLVSISPLPGEIVVAVARPQRQTVSLWDLWARRGNNQNAIGVNTSFVIGLKELDGEILYLNLGAAFGGEPAHEPHTLIAGATGSGKSVLIQALILDIAATNPSGLAQIFLIDPKMGVDYGAIERLPHLQGGIIVDQGRAIEVLENLVVEMDRRYTAFREAGARDLKTFNQKAEVSNRLPLIFLVHDEFAEWMMTDTYKDAVASTVQRLGVKARAAGIHLFFAAQRPDANVMPVQLRDNLGNRLILKVASVGTAEIALGSKGAESLLGLGHLAARLAGQIIFAQAPFLSDDDIERAVDAIAADDANV